jgi:hypothetical protein
MFDELLRELRVAALILLVVIAGAVALVFLLTHLPVALNADLATPLVVVGVAVFVFVTEAIKHRRRHY